MDQATLARAIEPFFSTKGIGKGTGLGLAMVDGLARQLGGVVTLYSQPGRGTQVDLWLLASETSSKAAKAKDRKPVKTKEVGLVLLVDDEDLVRMSVADMLGLQRDRGFLCREALARVRSGLCPDLVVTDRMMPGMTGADFAKALAAEYPDIPALIVSGYAEAEGAAQGFARRGSLSTGTS
jgi:CheY-like chemotaxis protein